MERRQNPKIQENVNLFFHTWPSFSSIPVLLLSVFADWFCVSIRRRTHTEAQDSYLCGKLQLQALIFISARCRSVSAAVFEAAARVFIVNTDIKLSRQTEDEDEDEEDVKVCMFLQPGCPPVWPGAETAAGVTHF